jgi:RNase P subunit RPR2
LTGTEEITNERTYKPYANVAIRLRQKKIGSTRIMKYCKKCDQSKESVEFNKKGPSYLQAWCRECYSTYYKAYNALLKASEARVHVESKVCNDCGLKKPRSQFGKREVSPDKLSAYCKPCWRVRSYNAKRKMMLNAQKTKN